MNTARILSASIACVVISAPAISAQDLSTYREFQLGTSLVTVARQAGVAAEPRVLHQRPALIEELMWQPPPVRGASPQADSVKKVLFSFYNGQLFRMVVSYDRDRTEGLTAEDMVAAISETYGLARLRATPLMPLARVDTDEPGALEGLPVLPQPQLRRQDPGELGGLAVLGPPLPVRRTKRRSGSSSFQRRWMSWRAPRPWKRLGSTSRRLLSEKSNVSEPD